MPRFISQGSRYASLYTLARKRGFRIKLCKSGLGDTWAVRGNGVCVNGLDYYETEKLLRGM